MGSLVEECGLSEESVALSEKKGVVCVLRALGLWTMVAEEPVGCYRPTCVYV